MSAIPLPCQVVHGFLITRVDSLPELRAGVVEATHVRTEARLLSLATDDPENLFAVAFPSPPTDNCGTPHILEHAVLAGSRRFPVKDPFVEMLKSSLATFINAFTCSDRTIFPVASNVAQDLFNLADVYLDAVFHPLISRDTLLQEGWRWAAERTAGGAFRLALQGVVLNEMRGAFSDLDTLVERESAARLFPAGTYGFDAGGEPAAIPDLTYEAFAAYYCRTYHPAKARFFFYGDIPLEAKLQFLDERLAGVVAGPVAAPVIVRQPAWRRPRRAQVAVGGRVDDDSDCVAATTISWLLGDLPDAETDLTWELLDRLLLGDDAAPLRRRLLESGFGDDLTSSGYLSDSLQTLFQVGIKGRTASRGRRLEQVVLETLEGLTRTGFEPGRVNDVIRQLEYSHREIDSGFPVHLMEDALNVWLYGLDPVAYLRLGTSLRRLRERVAQDPALLTRTIRRDLLANPHRLTLVLRPGRGGQPERERCLANRVRAARRSLDTAALTRLAEESAALERRQSQPNPPEALAALPVLRVADLPREPAAIRTSAAALPNGSVLLRHDVPCNGISYLSLALDLTGLPEPLLPYVPTCAAFLTRLGTAQRDYAGLSEALTRATGGVAAGAHLSPIPGGSRTARPFLVLQARTLDETCPDAIELWREILDEPDTSAERRLHDLLAQRRARLLAGVVPQGHHLAAMAAASHLGEYGRLCDLWRGPAQVEWAYRLAAADSGSEAGPRQALTQIMAWLRQGCPTYASFTGTDRVWSAVCQWLGQRPGPRPSAPPPAVASDRATTAMPGVAHGIAHAMDVAFCARCLPAADRLDPRAPLLQVAAQILSYDYLWEEIRAKGGAYGAFCSYDPLAGHFAMTSYSDPDILRTLGVFGGLRAATAGSAWTASDIERAVIACAREEEAPIRPGMATEVGLWRHIAGITQDVRRAWRQALLEARAEAVRDAALAMLTQAEGHEGTAVLSSRRRLKAALSAWPMPAQIQPLTGPRRSRTRSGSARRG